MLDENECGRTRHSLSCLSEGSFGEQAGLQLRTPRYFAPPNTALAETIDLASLIPPPNPLPASTLAAEEPATYLARYNPCRTSRHRPACRPPAIAAVGAKRKGKSDGVAHEGDEGEGQEARGIAKLLAGDDFDAFYQLEFKDL